MSRAAISEQVDASPSHLGTDCIDVFPIHHGRAAGRGVSAPTTPTRVKSEPEPSPKPIGGSRPSDPLSDASLVGDTEVVETLPKGRCLVDPGIFGQRP